MTKLITIVTGVYLLCGTVVQAEWVDDWLQQRSVGGPNYFNGQERGYYQGGSFSTRWSNTNDYPLTVETPRVKAGCGGIDVFLGGMSFMNTDYLVNKLQGILTNAAAVAFDLGLKTMCEQCSNTIKNFEAIADKLNSMQLEECAAAQGVVGVVMDENGFHSSEVMREKLGTAIKENKLVQGISEMWDIATKEDQANNNVPKTADVTRINSGCNSDITATFLSGGSLLENLGGSMGLPTGHTDLIRGLVGDVVLEGPASAYKVSHEGPCPQNNPDDIQGIAEGVLYAKAAGGSCSQIADTNRDLVQYVTDTLDGIATKIETRAALNTTQQDFLTSTPLSPLPILKTAIGTNMRESMITSLADLTAKAYSLQMLSDLYNRAETIAVKAKEMLEKEAGAASGQPFENCNPAVFAGHIDQDLSIMLKKIRLLQQSSREAYIASAKEITTIMNYMEQMQRIEQQMVSEITRRYGQDLASRLKL
ncbi:conjugal transfer protein TraH [Desulfopila aestuarii]|uniref:Conjugative transfer pilus assembly protein TraH n=1 Tax=Desulfopila aestuarii DSM 18488 TaxID=1121416 RepID=A0A1M7YHP8_9BACT|nr:conjugal transfer protein TraH [Desulfopila aestuarii]SHO52079.1 conjugative transfer pilus assembly protein TraH [Desulfopila aestuarii DSM 18488]